MKKGNKFIGFIVGMFSIVGAAILGILREIKSSIIQELPPDEDTEFSEKGR